MSYMSEIDAKTRQEYLSDVSTPELVDEIARRTELGRIDLSPSQDATIIYGRKGSSTRRLEAITGPARILVVPE
jgi:hypothetical protein